MKILMAAMAMGLGGAETHILELSRALARRGHEVFVASSGGVYAAELKKYGVKHIKAPLASKNTAAKAVLLLSRLIERERFDIVHAHARIPAFICGMLKKKYGFAFITTVHFDFRVTPLLRKITDWGERTLAVSEDIADSTARKYGIERDKIAVVNNGVDTARFSPQNKGTKVRESLGLEGKKIIMYLGRLDVDSFLPAKILLDTAEYIYRVQSDARFLIVGEGKKYAELCAKARHINEKLGLALALLPGGTAMPEQYFAACDVFVGPSRSAMEALAFGKPTVVAGNFGMLGVFSPEISAEALRTNFCCRGSAPIEAERVSTEILRLLSLSENEKEEISAYGREFIKKHCSTAHMADVCEAEYRSLLAKRGKKAVICGYYGAGNIGDEAMLGALLSALEKSEVTKITVLSASPAKTAARFGVCAVPRYDILRVERALAESDVLIFGGGNILQDKTSTRSLIYYSHIACLAKKHACKVAFSANGIGPVVRAENLALVKKALLCADYISMRDESSRALASQLTGRSDIFFSGELAFALSYGGAEYARGGRYFAVFPKLVENFKLTELKKFCLYMKRKHGLSPVFAPMHKSEDSPLCRRLAHGICGAVYADTGNEQEACGLIRGAVFTVCMRLHAAVFSAAERVPAISVSDDAKLASFLLAAGGAAFGTNVKAQQLAGAAQALLGGRWEKQKLPGKFAEEQKRLACAETARILEFLKMS